MFFAAAARELSRACRELGWATPTFRAPPRNPSLTRSIRRVGDRTVVAVRVRARSCAAVSADLVDGVLAANPHADQTVRTELLDRLERLPR